MAGSALLDANVILKIANLRPGYRVADFGAGGSGHLVLPAARFLADDGVVFAIDIHPEALSMLRGHRSLHSLLNLYPVRGDIERFGGVADIEQGSLDRIFLINTLWSARRRASIVSEARRLLAPNGQIIVVDWEPQTRHAVAPNSADRVAPYAVDRLFSEGGCQECGQFRASRDHWGRIYSH
ncbi:MAG: methyltransferase domain-containing protein [Patescibacteria group bacterium]